MSPAASPSGTASRERGSRLLARFDPEAVGLRELPFTVVFMAVAGLFIVFPVTTYPAWLALSTAVVLLVQLVASTGRWQRWARPWQYALPLIQMLSLVGLDYASSVNPSFYTILLFLPVVSLALQPGTVGVALGTVGTAAISLGATVALPGPMVEQPAALLGSFLVTICALLVGIGVYAVTQRLRDRTDDLLALQAKQESTLRTLERQHHRLSELTERLEESRDLFRSTVEAATEVLVLATDDSGRILISSPGAERVLTCSAANLVDTVVTDLFDPADLRSVAGAPATKMSSGALLAAAVGSAARGDPERREATFLRPDASTVPVELVVTRRRRLDAPDAQGYLFVVTDLTERKQGERLQDEFVGLVSHELRTPLASILGYIELLREDPAALGSEERRYVDVVERNAHRLLRLVNDLLLSVQLVAGTFTLTPDLVDAASVVSESVANLQPTAAAARVVLSLSAGKAAPLVTDPERLGQVTENLISNAVKFTPPGGSVQVTLTSKNSAGGRRGVHLVVADSGGGMSEEEIIRVTERFFRTDSARRHRVRGMGLGLSIVDAIVQAHGGTMTIHSEPGSGTTVVVALPDLDLSGQVQTDASADQ